MQATPRHVHRVRSAATVKALWVVITIVAVVAAAPPAFADRAGEVPRSVSLLRAEVFVVESSVQPVLEDILDASPTVRSQLERIATAAGVRVYISLTVALPSNRLAQTHFRLSGDGVEGRVEIATPLRTYEYAEWLAHELEHVLEQLEGVNLVTLARRDRGVVRSSDGSYETERAIGAGRRASLEVIRAGR